jgi:beta-glucosidase-like glycosyl hydrolase
VLDVLFASFALTMNIADHTTMNSTTNMSTTNMSTTDTGAYAVQYLNGAQKNPDDPHHLLLSMALKHFAGYQAETDRFTSNYKFSEFDLHDTYLKPFAMGFQQERCGFLS